MHKSEGKEHVSLPGARGKWAWSSVSFIAAGGHVPACTYVLSFCRWTDTAMLMAIFPMCKGNTCTQMDLLKWPVVLTSCFSIAFSGASSAYCPRWRSLRGLLLWCCVYYTSDCHLVQVTATVEHSMHMSHKAGTLNHVLDSCHSQYPFSLLLGSDETKEHCSYSFRPWITSYYSPYVCVIFLL